MRKLAVATLCCATLACAGGRASQREQPITVADSDYGRLQSGQTAIVDAARGDLAKARDAEARAKLRQTEARNQAGLAKADATAADAERGRGEALTKAANESRDPAQLAQAQRITQGAQVRKQAADAHMAYSQKLQAAADTGVTAAERRVAYESARVELAKLQALQAAQVPAATKYDGAKMQAQVDQSRKELEQAEAQARSADAEATTAQRNWEELNRQVQAYGG
jgi:hypothetical protein